MITYKILEIIKPDRLMLEYLSYIIAQKNIDVIEQVKQLVKVWIQLKMDNDLVQNLVNQLNDLDNAHKYIILSQKLELYENLFAEDIYDILYKYNQLYELYNIFKKLESENITQENINNILNGYILDIQEKLEKLTERQQSNLNILDYTQISNVNSTDTLKYVSFIPEIDITLNGFSQGLYLFAGVLGSGKSSLLLNLTMGFNIFVNLYEDNLKEKVTDGLIPSVVYITVENTYEQTLLRIKAILNDSSPIKLYEYRTPLKTLYELINMDKMIIANILYENATMTNIEKLIKQIINKGYHPTIIIVDYMDEIYINENIEHRHKLGLISRFLRNLALKYNSVVITATQMNRKAMDGKISVAFLSESIEHAKKADAVIGLVTGKTSLLNIKTANYKSLNQDKDDNKNLGPFGEVKTIIQEYPAMFLSVQKNRYNLILSDIGILSSPNSNIAFTSLVECLNFDISMAITNLKNKYINKPFITDILNKEKLFINMVNDIYGKVGARYEISKANNQANQHKLQEIIEFARLPYKELINAIQNYNTDNQINNQKINLIDNKIAIINNNLDNEKIDNNIEEEINFEL